MDILQLCDYLANVIQNHIFASLPLGSEHLLKDVTYVKVTTHSNNRNSKSSREVILGSVRL